VNGPSPEARAAVAKVQPICELAVTAAGVEAARSRSQPFVVCGRTKGDRLLADRYCSQTLGLRVRANKGRGSCKVGGVGPRLPSFC
jgi:hypothetical protein